MQKKLASEEESAKLTKENEGLRVLIRNLQVEIVEVTAYAPLCDEAIEGWDYEKDPTITASGEKVILWATTAGGPDIPFGLYLLIEGFGIWRINDQGSLIASEQIDIAVGTKAEARAFGREELKAVFLSDQQASLFCFRSNKKGTLLVLCNAPKFLCILRGGISVD